MTEKGTTLLERYEQARRSLAEASAPMSIAFIDKLLGAYTVRFCIEYDERLGEVQLWIRDNSHSNASHVIKVTELQRLRDWLNSLFMPEQLAPEE